MMIWSLFLKVVLRVLDILLSRYQKKNELKKCMIDYAKKHDEKVLNNLSIRKQYDNILKEEYYKNKNKNKKS